MFANLLLVLIHLCLVTVDLAIIAVVARLACRKCTWTGLHALHATLTPLADWVLATCSRLMRSVTNRSLRPHANATSALILLVVIRLTLTACMHALR